MSYRVVDAAGRSRPCADLFDALALVRAPGGSRVERTRDGALLAIRGRVPRETARLAPQETAVERTPDQELVERAVARAGSLRTLASAIERAGSVPALAKLLGCSAPPIYSARSGYKPLSATMVVKLAASLGDGDAPAGWVAPAGVSL